MGKLHDDLKAVCKVLSADLSRVVEKLESVGNVISPSDLDYVDKLTHAIKSVETTKAMLSATHEEEHHPDEKMITDLKSMMSGVTDEHTLTEFQRFITNIESK